MIKNPRKLKGIQYTNYPRSEEAPSAIEKNLGYRVFLQRKYLDSN
jgi:hypothetical protein